MSIDLSGLLQEPHDPLDLTVPCTLTSFQLRDQSYPVLEKSDLKLQIFYVEKGRVEICGQCRLVLELPCDRCLDPVPWEFSLDFDRRAVAAASGEEIPSKDTDEPDGVDGCQLDPEELLRSEIMAQWPEKVLCREDCKGLCSVCGQNLNHGTCHCDDPGLDPRMAAIRDVFSTDKEV